jgi:long-chain fatty acid transport protein
MFRPTSRLRIGFAYHESIMLEFRQFIDATIEGLGRLLVDVSGSSLYSPHRCTLGASFAVTPTLLIAADLEWAMWSHAPDPSLQFELLLDVGALGIEPRQYGSAQVALGAVDTFAPKVGIEWRVSPRYTLRGGYAYVPTPLPAQTGTTNVIDTDAHQVGVGAAVHFANPLARDQAPLAIELGTQVTLLSDRKMTKSAADDPIGDYTAAGSIWHTSVTLNHHFSTP